MRYLEGLKRSRIAIILLGFVVFASLFITATNNTNLFANADTSAQIKALCTDISNIIKDADSPNKTPSAIYLQGCNEGLVRGVNKLTNESRARTLALYPNNFDNQLEFNSGYLDGYQYGLRNPNALKNISSSTTVVKPTTGSTINTTTPTTANSIKQLCIEISNIIKSTTEPDTIPSDLYLEGCSEGYNRAINKLPSDVAKRAEELYPLNNDNRLEFGRGYIDGHQYGSRYPNKAAATSEPPLANSANNTSTQSTVTIKPTPTPTPKVTDRVIFIYARNSCIACVGVESAVTKLVKDFEAQTKQGRLGFTKYDFDTNQQLLKDYTTRDKLPVIIFKENDLEITRFSGSQSYDALKTQMGYLLSHEQNQTSPLVQNIQAIIEGDKLKVSATTNPIEVNKAFISILFDNGAVDNIQVTPTSTGGLSLTRNIGLGQRSPIADLLVPIANAQSTNKPNQVKITPINSNGQVGKPATTKIAQTSTTPSQPQPSAVTNGATGATSTGLKTLIDTLKGLTKKVGDGTDGGEIEGRVLLFIRLLFSIASATMVLSALWTGIMYITSMGNEEQATKAKKNFINIISGLVVLLATFSIIQIIRALLEKSRIGT